MTKLMREASKHLKLWNNVENRQPLLVTGARQVGKTSLIRYFGETEYARFHEFNFEESRSLHKIFEGDLNPQTIIRELSLFSDQAIDPEKDLIFFDEIQTCPSALNSLKYFAERLPRTAVIAAGSLLGLHLSGESFPVGKVDRLSVYPLNFSEFVNATMSESVKASWQRALVSCEVSSTLHDRLWSCFLDYLIVGGLPGVVMDFISALRSPTHLKEAYDAARRRQFLISKDYVADIAKHAGKANARHIESVWNQIPLQLSRVLDQSTSRFQFKNVVPGINSYRDLSGPIDWLTQAGLALRIPLCHHAELPLSAFTTENMFKLYVFDTGLLGCLLDLRPYTVRDFGFKTYKGFFVENFVAQELVASSNASQIYCWSEAKAEIEFLIQGIKGPLPIEVKSGTRVRSKSVASFLERYHPSTSVILSGRGPSAEIKNSKGGPTEMINWPLYFAGMLWKK